MSNIILREEALLKAAKKLDISPSKYRQAMERYSSMQTYLQNGEYRDAKGKPEIYLQGSFKLGTEIRPYRDCKDADYDVDMVCRLEHEKDNTSPDKVKHQVGDHLKEHGTYSKMLDDEGKRCWTLNYAEQDGIGFHMDILPSVQETWSPSSDHYWFRSAIAVTNQNSEDKSYTWTTSNPKDFAEWFYDKNKTVFENIKLDQKQTLFESYKQDGLFADRDSVPNIHVKTPLQRAIQLLKRHRDIRFSKHESEKFKPISMVITVLATQAYRNESTIYETLSNLVDTFSRHADQLQPTFRFDEAIARSSYTLITRRSDGTWLIPNPTNLGENFADRWHEDHHSRAKAFFQWVGWVKDDFVNIAERLDEGHYTQALGYIEDRGALTTATTRALTFNVPHREKPHWPVKLVYSVRITAKYKNHSGWESFLSADPLTKHLNLMFNASTNVEPPFQVYWQVVNTGQEAESWGQLRGRISPSKTAGIGGLTQTETTSYTGIHWVECFIVKNGTCVARSGEFVVRIV